MVCSSTGKPAIWVTDATGSDEANGNCRPIAQGPDGTYELAMVAGSSPTIDQSVRAQALLRPPRRNDPLPDNEDRQQPRDRVETQRGDGRRRADGRQRAGDVRAGRVPRFWVVLTWISFFANSSPRAASPGASRAVASKAARAPRKGEVLASPDRSRRAPGQRLVGMVESTISHALWTLASNCSRLGSSTVSPAASGSGPAGMVCRFITRADSQAMTSCAT